MKIAFGKNVSMKKVDFVLRKDSENTVKLLNKQGTEVKRVAILKDMTYPNDVYQELESTVGDNVMLITDEAAKLIAEITHENRHVRGMLYCSKSPRSVTPTPRC